MRVYGFVFCLIIWGWGSVSAQTVSIHGQNSAYAGKVIHISIERNPFITLPNSILKVTCDDSGSFEQTLEVETRTIVHLEFGVYKAYLYVEPGINYELELPEYRGKAYAEIISPFFQPIEIPLHLLSRSSMSNKQVLDSIPELNYSIAQFDSVFLRKNDEVIMNRRLGIAFNLDSMERSLELAYINDTSRYFRDYRRYKYGVLSLNEGLTGLENISLNYLGPDIRESHPGFMELFNAMFKDFIFYYIKTPRGKGLMKHINRTHNIDSVRYSIRQHPAVWNDTLADMVLLQELSNMFYVGDFHKDAILILLDSMVKKPMSSDFGEYAMQLKEKLTSLLIGHPPPQFKLTDLEGTLCSPKNFEGKYIYLMFCTPDHYGCMMEYPFLQSFYLKHSEYLEVLTIMVAEKESLAKDFMKKNGYGWKALYFEGQPGILSDFQVKAFPTAYLIGPDGNLVLSPAPLPTDGFEQHLFRIMRSRGEI